jgi:hypothetical protein
MFFSPFLPNQFSNLIETRGSQEPVIAHHIGNKYPNAANFYSNGILN